jgi:hypothetical protein
LLVIYRVYAGVAERFPLRRLVTDRLRRAI